MIDLNPTQLKMQKIYTIAEIGQAHEGSLGMAHAYIDALAPTGVNAIKFQVHIAEAESSIHEPFRIKFSFQDATRMDYWKRMEFSTDQWNELKNHCEARTLDFIASPFSNTAVHLLKSIGTRKFKIASGEVNNKLLIQHLADTGKELIVSSGMSSLIELDECLSFLINKNLTASLLQCTSAYPTQPDQWGLNMIPVFKERYGIPVGFSDHSGDIYASLAAVAHGAALLEFHTVFDKRMFGPDTSSSVTIDQVSLIVNGAKQIAKALQHPVDKNAAITPVSLKHIFQKSLAVNKKLPAGHIITDEDLEAKKPANQGIPAHSFEQVTGQQLIREMAQWDFLTWQDIRKADLQQHHRTL